jgi:hypothetical protein
MMHPSFICGDDSLQKLARCNVVKDATKKTFFYEGIKKLGKRWNRCVEVEGDYNEK